MVYSVAQADAALDEVFAALAHRTRRDIVRYLAGQSTAPRMNVVAADNRLSPQLLNKHTAALERAGLVSRATRGRHSHLVLHAGVLGAAERWVRETRAFWEHQMNSLESYVAELTAGDPDSSRRTGDG